MRSVAHLGCTWVSLCPLCITASPLFAGDDVECSFTKMVALPMSCSLLREESARGTGSPAWSDSGCRTGILSLDS